MVKQLSEERKKHAAERRFAKEQEQERQRLEAEAPVLISEQPSLQLVPPPQGGGGGSVDTETTAISLVVAAPPGAGSGTATNFMTPPGAASSTGDSISRRGSRASFISLGQQAAADGSGVGGAAAGAQLGRCVEGGRPPQEWLSKTATVRCTLG